MTLDQLFEDVTKVIAKSRNEITEEDKLRATLVFTCVDNYLIKALPGYLEEKFNFDFESYADKIYNELEVSK